LFSICVFSMYAKAQLLFPPRTEQKDTVPIHSHADSMYAKVVVNINVSPHTATTYEIQRMICNGCDSSRIMYIQTEALKISKQQQGLKTTKTDYGLETGVRYILPVTFLIPRYGKYPK